MSAASWISRHSSERQRKYATTATAATTAVLAAAGAENADSAPQRGCGRGRTITSFVGQFERERVDLQAQMLLVPLGQRLVGARRGQNGVLLPRAAHELERGGQPAVAEAIRDDDG